MEKKERTWRCTRNLPYKDAPDPSDISARQGHYIVASTEKEALAQMEALFPEEVGEFTIQPWS